MYGQVSSEVVYVMDVESFYTDQRRATGKWWRLRNHTERVKPLALKKFVQATTLLFGSEGGGLTEAAIAVADDVREIESFGVDAVGECWRGGGDCNV